MQWGGYLMRVSLVSKTVMAVLALCLLFSTGVDAKSPDITSVTSRQSDWEYAGFYLGADNQVYDPKEVNLASVPPIVPAQGADNADEVWWFVNGAGNDVNMHLAVMQVIADTTNRQVIGFHNHASKPIAELLEMVVPFSPLGATLKKQILLRADEEGTDVHLLSSSQGAVYVSRAIKDVKRSLFFRYPFDKNRRQEILGRIEVETIGGAAHKWPSGPHYVHYANKLDNVPSLLGVMSPMSRLGKGTVIVRFEHQSDCYLNPCDTNGLASGPFAGILDLSTHAACVYLGKWHPFKEMYSWSDPKGIVIVDL